MLEDTAHKVQPVLLGISTSSPSPCQLQSLEQVGMTDCGSAQDKGRLSYQLSLLFMRRLHADGAKGVVHA